LATIVQTSPYADIDRQKADGRGVLGTLFLCGWICVLLQGALRKWVFPGVTALYLIQDVPLIVAYGYAVLKGYIWAGKVMIGCMLVAILLSIETLTQLVVIDLNTRTALIGLHQYIFYFPILFLMPMCLDSVQIPGLYAGIC